ncbi:MAG: LURP-one-related family protein [Streptococcaceae bacterium]|jgi:uncharacterized protein YxjI|nr:LURP-one-related family protein [Streptococcaceae bacterium]
MTKNLYFERKLLSIKGKATITDEAGNVVYQTENKIFSLRPTFYIQDASGNTVATITGKAVSLLPKFFVEIDGREKVTITKKISFLKPKYEIDGAGITVNGNYLDMNFEILKNGAKIGQIDKKWVSIKDKYQIEVDDESEELLVLAMVLTVDFIKEQERRAATN